MSAGHTTRTWVRRCASRHADRTIAGWACTRWIVKEVADVLVVGPIAVACPHPQTTIATSTAADAGQRRFICTESRSGDTPEHCPRDGRALQSSQTMLTNRRPAAQLWVDSDPDEWVDVQRQRKPIAEQTPARPYVNRAHSRATFRPALQVICLTPRSRLCTELSPGPRGGTHLRPTDVEAALPDAHPTTTATSSDPRMTASPLVAVAALPGSLRT